eukprot:TRINITY_DN36967_c0_g1_i2.p2 TRINITY_DN36967_c0_g1~~TRINITY_DN36967_c0_g1_i2.p2  ORF type:complete len:139 (-),score=16.49 TRINITY_DN36967_c0_g1_i2:850-1266(-)
MVDESFPPKFKQPNLWSYDGSTSSYQHLCHFKVLTGEIANNDALKIRLFPITLKGTAFDLYKMLPVGSLSSWKDLEQKLVDHFFDTDSSVTIARLCSEKQGKDESVAAFIKWWQAFSFKCPENVSHESLTDMCRANML